MVFLAESLASLLYNMAISDLNAFLILYSQTRIGDMFYTLLSSINLSGVTCTFVGATSVSLMSGFSSTMFTVYYGPWIYVVAFMVSIYRVHGVFTLRPASISLFSCYDHLL